MFKRVDLTSQTDYASADIPLADTAVNNSLSVAFCNING